MTLTDKMLIGILESGLYTLADGHLYHSNNVIKIRYDLINSPLISKYSSKQIFDFYFDIFKIEKTERIKSTTPLQSNSSHRFAYIIYDKKE